MLGEASPYKMCPSYGDLTEEEVEKDVERFYIKYMVSRGIDEISQEDVNTVFFLYISQYFIHKDSSVSENMN